MRPIPALPRSARLARDRRGSAMVEFAIVLPLMVALLFATIEMGNALRQHQALEKSVRDASRYLARIQLACPASDDATSWSAARTEAVNLALTGRITGGTPLVDVWTAGTFSVADPACETWSGRAVQVITVTGQFTYTGFGFVELIGLTPFQITAAHQQVHIGE